MLLNKIIVSVIIFFACINNLFAASEQLFKKHENSQKKFNLTVFRSLPFDLQRSIADFFEPNSEEFKNDLVRLYYIYNYKLSDKLVTNLADEFFYNHAIEHIVSQSSNVDPRIIRPIAQKSSNLCKITVSSICPWTVLNIAILQNNRDLVSKSIDMQAKSLIDDPLDMAIVLKRSSAIIQLLKNRAYVEIEDTCEST